MRTTVGRNYTALAIKNPCLGRHARKTLRSEWLIFQKTEPDMDRWETRLRIALLVFISAKNNLSVKQLRKGFLWGGVPAHTTPPQIKQPHLANGNTTEVRIIFSARLLTKSLPFGNVVKCCLCNWWSPSIYPHFSRLTFKEGHSTTKYVAGGWLRGSGFLSRCKGFPTMEKLLFMNPRSCPIPLCYPFRDGIYHSTSEHLVHANLSHEPYPLDWQRIKIASRSKNSKKRKDTGWNN